MPRYAYLFLVDIVQIVKIFRAVVETVGCHQGVCVSGVFVVAVSLAIDRKHHKASSREFDGVLKLHFTVVEIAVGEYDAGSGVVRSRGIRLEEYAADDFPVDILFLSRDGD